MTRNINQEATVAIPLGIFHRLESVASATGESAEEIALKALERYLAEIHLPEAGPSKPGRLTAKELEASYQAMAADEGRELEAREWCGSYLGEDLVNETR